MSSMCSVSNSESMIATRWFSPRAMSQAAGKFVMTQCQFHEAVSWPATTWPGWVKIVSLGVRSMDICSPGWAASMRHTAGSWTSRPVAELVEPCAV